MSDEDYAKAVADRLAEVLRAARAEKRLPQDRVAVAAGISRNHYLHLESGVSTNGNPANPRLRTLLGLATALDLQLTELVEPLDAMTPPTPSPEP